MPPNYVLNVAEKQQDTWVSVFQHTIKSRMVSDEAFTYDQVSPLTSLRPMLTQYSSLVAVRSEETANKKGSKLQT
jgi:hypothetical protein